MLTTELCAAGIGRILAFVLAQAEPAPPEPPPPPPPSASPAGEQEAPVEPANAVAVHGRFAYRADDDVPFGPREGFSLGATFDHRYARPAPWLALSAELDFFHDHFSSAEQLTGELPSRIAQDSFVALQKVTFGQARGRPWIAAGAGGTVADKLYAVVRGALGVDVMVAHRTAVVLRGDYTHPFGLAAGALADVGVGLLVQF